MKASEFRNLSAEELLEKEKSLKKELFDLTFERNSGRVEKPGRFKAIRRDIARIETILTELRKENKDGKSK